MDLSIINLSVPTIIGNKKKDQKTKRYNLQCYSLHLVDQNLIIHVIQKMEYPCDNLFFQLLNGIVFVENNLSF